MAKRKKKGGVHGSGTATEAEKKGLLAGQGPTRRALTRMVLMSATAALCAAVLFNLLPRLAEIKQDTMQTGKDFSHHQTRFCLNVIMKNEEEVLERLFDSVVEEIAGWYVCDTGSTDGSVELTKSYFRSRGIPGRVKHHPWNGYSWNRNKCMDDGKQEMANHCDYWLIMDADQVMVNDSPSHFWERGHLTADGYMLKEDSYGLFFYRLSVVRVNGDAFEFQGSIHETMVIREGVSSPVVGEIPPEIYAIHNYIQTRDIDEDIHLLLKDLEREPESSRLHFFLAKTYRGLVPMNESTITSSLHHFSKRISLHTGTIKHDTEETFLCYLHVGMLFEQLYIEDILRPGHSKHLMDHGIISSPITTVEGYVALYMDASKLLEYRYEPYASMAFSYWVQARDGAKCFEVASKGIRVGSLGDANTIATFEKDIFKNTSQYVSIVRLLVFVFLFVICIFFRLM